MQFQASDTLKSRTYLGLIVAQFLAAFNDQAIHAAAMFYAINEQTLTKDSAITLMPMLFYAPWAIFCTLAGYLADRYSKRHSLVFWKIAEVVITLVALAGFWMGTALHNPWGPWIVLSAVFLMGTHSAFFVPAKYGVMPEILQPHLLSKGNGVLESTSFLAVILGTVSGGILSSVFKGQEYFIGVILVVLAVIGAVASLLIRTMPAANPHRPFPTNLARPLLDNLRIMFRSKPLALAVLGIAFFTFMVAFMRVTMYMHGESQIPRWKEFETSLVVATVALGIGLGSPLAGNLSGGKVELGLVPLGALGMIAAAVLAALTLQSLPGLVTSLILIGFFSGFYIVPLYTLLQHRAPKTSKGDLIATSNFINVTGAILASLLFSLLVPAARWTGIAHVVPQQEVVEGRLVRLEKLHGSEPIFVEVRGDTNGRLYRIGQPLQQVDLEAEADPLDFGGGSGRTARVPIKVTKGLADGAPVAVSQYDLHGVEHFEVRPAHTPLPAAYDESQVPRYLFLGAALMTLGILLLLCRQLPDFFVRALLWVRSHGRYRLKVVGQHNLPTEGPVILATNCDRFESCLQVVAATDRFTRFILVESPEEGPPRPLLRYLARRTGLVAIRPGEGTPALWAKALDKALRTLGEGNLLGVTLVGPGERPEMAKLLGDVQARTPAPILPVYCGTRTDGREPLVPRVQIVLGHALPADASWTTVRAALDALADWTRQKEEQGMAALSVEIPGVHAALSEGQGASGSA